MQIEIVTLFPGMFKGPLGESIIKIAQKKGKLKIKLHNLRKWTSDKHRTADDKPFGGGAGMVIKVEPVYRALEEIIEFRKKGLRKKELRKRGLRIILLTPQGKRLDQKVVKRLSRLKRLVLICGHYEGVDERIRKLIDEEISIGDYILSCGEMPACVIVDSVTRLLPGVLGNPKSSNIETFENNLLEYPQYTRPRVFEGMKVPRLLLDGNHNDIETWRKAQALKRTKKKRPDLLKEDR